MSMPSELAKTNVHLAKGKRMQRAVENGLRRAGYADAVKYCGAIAYEVARDSQLEAARRMKRAKRHARTMDLFEGNGTDQLSAGCTAGDGGRP